MATTLDTYEEGTLEWHLAGRYTRIGDRIDVAARHLERDLPRRTGLMHFLGVHRYCWADVCGRKRVSLGERGTSDNFTFVIEGAFPENLRRAMKR